MNRCPISYEPLETGEVYSADALKRLSRSLRNLEAFPYSAEDQVREAAQRATKMSIQGVQPKLSARLNSKKGGFEIVDKNGQYILKPQTHTFPQLPENEDLTMKMANTAGIEVPIHGLIYSRDRSLTYFIKRFDRVGKNKKLPLDDFSQLTGSNRETKYSSSMEKVARVVEEFCTFPAIEKVKLFRLTLFNFLVGNEDMHLKNFSLITRNGKIELSPAYDLLNTSIVLEDAAGDIEEIALPVKGRKKKLTARLLIDYYGKERLDLNLQVITTVIKSLTDALPQWEHLIKVSFLSGSMKEKYSNLLTHRREVLGI
ncbi:MAG: HipA domain-containing protein [bacterium]|nr:HipA domain-containing protein [bacterium]